MKSKDASKDKSKGKASSQNTRSVGQGDPSPDCPREQMIAEAAYFHAERRGFVSGYEVADWLQAEADLGHLF